MVLSSQYETMWTMTSCIVLRMSRWCRVGVVRGSGGCDCANTRSNARVLKESTVLEKDHAVGSSCRAPYLI